MDDCLLCKVDKAATDEGVYRAMYFALGAAHESLRLCEEHERRKQFAVRTLAVLTGYTPPTERPKLRLVSTSAPKRDE